MPQMSPLGWLTLMMFFSIMFMMFNIMNFFYTEYSLKPKISKMNKTFINWKW
uniref:ATP synthase complex subunit 8 n=1 Tax=Coleoptera sp. 2 AH-2016 TaxID=1903824 RepID=A0A343C2F5_9COLE|nr:ATP synthase F0 subunit 8 [Coleoptera sp. 2 AH-2016]